MPFSPLLFFDVCVRLLLARVRRRRRQRRRPTLTHTVVAGGGGGGGGGGELGFSPIVPGKLREIAVCLEIYISVKSLTLFARNFASVRICA